MQHIAEVEPLDRRRSRWMAVAPLGVSLEWQAEVFNEREDEMIAWRSLPGGDVESAGTVHFESLADNQSTKVSVTMKYNPPAGRIGDQIASLFGQGLDQQLAADLLQFKTLMETHENASS
jgi:uncharacterized membrane protein